MIELNTLEEPVSSDERFLHAIAVRLDVLIHMMSSFLEVYADKNKIATTSNEIVEKIEVQEVQPRRTRKK